MMEGGEVLRRGWLSFIANGEQERRIFRGVMCLVLKTRLAVSAFRQEDRRRPASQRILPNRARSSSSPASKDVHDVDSCLC